MDAMFFRLFHRGWVKTTGIVLDKIVRSQRGGSNHLADAIFLYNYVVEFVAPDGEPSRRVVKQKFDTMEFGVGAEVPLLVRPDGKKAVFDRTDPRIRRVDPAKEHAKAAEERFRKSLEG